MLTVPIPSVPKKVLTWVEYVDVFEPLVMMLVDTIGTNEYKLIALEEPVMLVGVVTIDLSELLTLNTGKYVDVDVALKLLLFELGVDTSKTVLNVLDPSNPVSVYALVP